MHQHARRRRIAAAEECAHHLEEEGLLVEAQLILHIRQRRAQEAHAVGEPMGGGVGVEALHDAFGLGQSSEAAVEVRIGALGLAHREVAQ